MSINSISIAIILCVFFSSAFAEEYPKAPGVRYDVGGYKLHMLCKGQGQPTVIIDTGLGDDSTAWFDIQNKIAKNTHTCVYDRAGYGWSDAGPQPRTSVRIANELEALVHKAKLVGPFILVGHSFGGYNMRVFAANHPEEVMGIVLVDASHENQYEMLNIKLPQNYNRKRNIIIFPKPSGDPMTTEQSMLKERAINAARSEISSLYQSALQVKHLRHLPNVPLVVISRGQSEWQGQKDAENREKIWVHLQQDLWKLTPHSQHLFAFHSGHDIHLHQPDIIVSAVLDMVSSRRAQVMH
ncbi:alpha/beta fold hydrolase [Methylophaga sulfidovorans]|uniref:Pimeloyl-ACP methyl ester carboxylesterase n=1 Tax=Methylophaga sulfidovorans TaxID=45496 RepID=A0A1I3YFC8_9GAMM|nr:alpha/beta hydrolase [Methylophaga sulfidovorans]SFK30558.1 Pimeloyl-ACP methyl ester carboxylesterase [Methylophaga sulfidovorans]